MQEMAIRREGNKRVKPRVYKKTIKGSNISSPTTECDFALLLKTWNSLTWGKSVLATRQTSEHRQDVLFRGSCFLLLIEQHHCLMVGVNIPLFSVSFIYVRCGRFEFWRFFDHRTNNVCFDFVHMQYFSMQAMIYVCDEISKR